MPIKSIGICEYCERKTYVNSIGLCKKCRRLKLKEEDEEKYREVYRKVAGKTILPIWKKKLQDKG